jgi:hypothetical protein
MLLKTSTSLVVSRKNQLTRYNSNMNWQVCIFEKEEKHCKTKTLYNYDTPYTLKSNSPRHYNCAWLCAKFAKQKVPKLIGTYYCIN